MVTTTKGQGLPWTLENSALWLGEDSEEHVTLGRTLGQLIDMGWRIKSWDAPNDKSVRVYSVTVVKGNDRNSQRREIQMTVRTEWDRRSTEPKTAVFVDKVSLIAYPKLENIVFLPVNDDADSTVVRDNPLVTAVSLELYTDQEIWDTYNPEARTTRASQGLQESAADVLRGMLD